MPQYERILRALRYYNNRADTVDYMTFTLTCARANAQRTSNQFTVEVSVASVSLAAVDDVTPPPRAATPSRRQQHVKRVSNSKFTMYMYACEDNATCCVLCYE